MRNDVSPTFLARAIVVVTAAALVVVRFLAIDSASHSASDTIRPWLIQATAIAIIAAILIVAIGRLGRGRPGR